MGDAAAGKPLIRKAAAFLRRDAVFTVSFLLAAGSFAAAYAAASPADARTVLGFIDQRVLVCLFLLMAAVEGLRSEGVLEAAAARMVARASTMRSLSFALVGLAYFSAMIVTNDVALLTFVPFTLLALRLAGRAEYAGPVVVLETVAANLGSALTPVGNPQNLYLYSRFGMTPSSFFGAVLPLALPSAALLTAGVLLLGKTPVLPGLREPAVFRPRPRLLVFAAVFAVALIAVFDGIPPWAALAAGLIPLLAFARAEVRKVDYALLLTFVFFFVFIGNITRIPAVSGTMRSLLTGPRTVFLAGAGLSQAISNVPAAILLSGFTGDVRSLLRGVDVGGCGTLVASLASLISYKAYLRANPGLGSRYVVLHTLVNLPFLVLLTVFCLAIQ